MSTEHDQWGCAGTGGEVWLGKEEKKWDTLSGEAGHRDGEAMPGCDTHEGPRGLGAWGEGPR